MTNWGAGERPTEGYNDEKETKKRSFSSSFDGDGDLQDKELNSLNGDEEDKGGGSWIGEIQGDFSDLEPSVADLEEENYRANAYKEEIKSEIKSQEEILGSLDDSNWLEVVAKGADKLLTGGLLGAATDTINKLTQSGEEALNEAEKDSLKAQLKVALVKNRNRLGTVKDQLSYLEEQYPEKYKEAIMSVSEYKNSKAAEKGVTSDKVVLDDKDYEVINKNVNNIVAQVNPEIAAQQRKIASEELIKSYNPNANLNQFGFVDPRMLGVDGNPAIEAGLEQLRQTEAKRAEAQNIRDNTIGQMDGWTKLNTDNRDAWAKYYNPSDYQATTSTAQGTTVAPASQVNGQYQADLGVLKGTQTDVNLTNTDAWQKYFKGVDGYTAETTEAGKTFVAPTASLTGQYQADTSSMRDFNPNIMTSEERARAVRAGQMMEDRATGKAPSVAELSYEQNLNKLIQSQQATASSQRGSSNPLAMRSVAQQASQLGQQAVMDTAIAKAKEQQEAELAMASQANQLMIADQQKFAQQKQMELESKTNTLQAELQNAKAALEKDMFNIDAQNKVNQLQAQIDSNLAQFNAQQRNVGELQNVQNQMQMTQYAGGQEQQKMLADLQAQTTSRANELQKNIQYTQGLLQNAQVELSKDQFNVDARNKVNQLQAQLDSQNSQFNAELQTRTSLANAQSNLNSSSWAGQMAQEALGQQLQQERADTLSQYGVSRDALGTELDILGNLANTQIGLGSSQKGWNYQQQQIDAQNEANDNTWYGGLINTGANVLSTGLKVLGE